MDGPLHRNGRTLTNRVCEPPPARLNTADSDMALDTVKRINAGDTPMSLAAILAAFASLERRCVEAGLIREHERERFRDARITLAVRVVDEDRLPASREGRRPRRDPPNKVEDQSLSSAAARLERHGGRRGGLARASKLSPERRSQIAREAARKRWARATAEQRAAWHEAARCGRRRKIV